MSDFEKVWYNREKAATKGAEKSTCMIEAASSLDKKPLIYRREHHEK